MQRQIDIIVIGGSAGALEALSQILAVLPRDFQVPVVLALHLPAGRPNLLPKVLADKCWLSVKEPDDKELIAAGHLYVAPPNYHLLTEKNGLLSLSVDDPVMFSRPSIDVLFESVADAYGGAAAAVLLSGANEDGARGLAAIADAGGVTLVQSPESAAVRTMPDAAVKLSRVDHLLPADELGLRLVSLAAARTP